MSITIDNFGPNNRDRYIGRSLYRICRESDDSGKWYIYESYANDGEWSGSRAYFNDDLQYVIDKLNGFDKEKEIIRFVYEKGGQDG